MSTRSDSLHEPRAASWPADIRRDIGSLNQPVAVVWNLIAHLSLRCRTPHTGPTAFWDTVAGATLKVLEGHTSEVYACALSAMASTLSRARMTTPCAFGTSRAARGSRSLLGAHWRRSTPKFAGSR